MENTEILLHEVSFNCIREVNIHFLPIQQSCNWQNHLLIIMIMVAILLRGVSYFGMIMEMKMRMIMLQEYRNSDYHFHF